VLWESFGGEAPKIQAPRIRQTRRVNLRQLFDLSLAGRRDRVALEWNGAEYTFGDIDDRSNRMAHALAARGIAQGDRVCVYLANCIELIDLFLACVKLGAIFVPINILYRDREMSHILSDAEPKLLVTERELPELLASGDALPDGRASNGRDSACSPTLTGGAGSAQVDNFPDLDGDAPAALVYTSGTTGTSKGAILTHNNFAANAINLLTCWQITEQDRFLLALPLFHVHALGNGLHCWLMSGCRMRLLERFEHQTAAAQFLDFKPTLFFGVPTMYVRLLETPEPSAREIGARMRLFVSGSAPLAAQVHEDFRGLFGHTILERYGMSETLMNTSNPYIGERRAGTVGLPMPGVSVRLDENGEVWVKGPNVFAGYWRREDATRAAFADGWFRTGDIAERSVDGYYTLSGRKSDLIISGGFNIYPREIEEFLAEQPEIAEAAVVGEADRVRGEIPVAYVVMRVPLDGATIEARCREKLASFKIPRRFEIVDKLPRNALGKVQKHLLCRA
jgi:malonyl-CoA/methylmalonyl-CoA synthetase